jgi:prevent-host-death family protein
MVLRPSFQCIHSLGITGDNAALSAIVKSGYNMTMVRDHGRIAMKTTIAAGEFKAKCLKLLDEVAETRKPLVITKRGKAVARLVPEPKGKQKLFGSMKGSVLWEGDIISPIDVEWEAMK